MRDRLWKCAAANLLEKSDVAALDHGTELLRTVEHVVRLVSGRSYKWIPPTENARMITEKLVERILSRKMERGLEVELTETLTNTRKIYEKLSTLQAL
jgi:glutamine synthetase adenylyltransferase